MSSVELLKVLEISKSFGGIKALDNINLILKRHEILGLIGPNGSGKTTLVNIIAGFYKPEKGRVFFDGEDITNIPPHLRVLKGIARTFQLTKPFLNLSVFDNVMVGALLKSKNLSEAREKTMRMLEILNIKNFSQRISVELPTGIKKKIEIARVLVMEPKVLLLDEALAGLSPREIDEILDLIVSIKNELGVSLILIEHIIKAVMKVSDRIVVLSAGKVIADDLPENIVRAPIVREAYLGKGFEYERDTET